jgi:hypothetical protein
LGYLSFWLAGKLRCFDGQGHPWRLVVSFLPTLLALWIGLTRLQVRNHPFDVSSNESELHDGTVGNDLRSTSEFKLAAGLLASLGGCHSRVLLGRGHGLRLLQASSTPVHAATQTTLLIARDAWLWCLIPSDAWLWCLIPLMRGCSA